MILTLDFETFYDTKDKYSLKSMKTIDYVRDPRFEVLGVSLQEDDGEPFWVEPDDIQAKFDSYNWEEITLVCHNTYFDGLILFEHYRKIPSTYHDTLSMSRALFPYAPTGHGLDSLSRALGSTGKLGGVLEGVNGKRYADLRAEEVALLGEYACVDVTETYFCYSKILPAFPKDELELMSLTLRWGCVPTIQVDVPRAEAALEEHNKEQAEVIEACGVAKTKLSSNQQFAKYLIEELGLEPPTKLNAKEKVTWAFSKGDLQFQEFMADHPEHKALWKARLEAKSNITRTRLAALIKIGKSGPLPMPLKYCGAHTLRWSGADGINPQNWPKKGAIRSCIVAPPGYQIVVLDQKQIELRVNMLFCGELEWLRICHEEDIYSITAAQHFQMRVEDVDHNGPERFFGKTVELGLGFGMGWRKFRRQCALKGILLSDAEAYHVVNNYRNSRPGVPMMWRRLTNALPTMYSKQGNKQIGPITLVHQGVRLPNGMTLDYPNLTPTEDGDWFYGKPGQEKKIYGGMMLENFVQALARCIIADNVLHMHREIEHGTIFTTTHDEIALLARDQHADQVFKQATEIMGRSPSWAPNLPLVGEGGYDRHYSKS